MTIEIIKILLLVILVCIFVFVVYKHEKIKTIKELFVFAIAGIVLGLIIPFIYNMKNELLGIIMAFILAVVINLVLVSFVKSKYTGKKK
jgi:tellurite resistance protein TehA-like permease